MLKNLTLIWLNKWENMLKLNEKYKSLGNFEKLLENLINSLLRC